MIPKEAGEMVAATIRTIFAQPAEAAVRAQLDSVAEMLGKQFPKVSLNRPGFGRELRLWL
ncbi:hypothetical protein GCM10010193_63150 [Kitasatospora atroaurantiaca]|uniref:Mutator family transposase n=1 Tax=Kitasatospora atroaurantiaca TaxID=285545 RepID=A0A561F1K0_9ACTN|nr:mutator family transposase [Kitasatospora atroaurantiaca]